MKFWCKQLYNLRKLRFLGPLPQVIGNYLLSFVLGEVKCSLDKHFAVVVDVDAW